MENYEPMVTKQIWKDIFEQKASMEEDKGFFFSSYLDQ